MRDSTRLDGRPTRRERESAQSERRSPLVSISSLVDHLLERDGARGSNRSVSCVSSSRRRLGRTGKDDDEDEERLAAATAAAASSSPRQRDELPWMPHHTGAADLSIEQSYNVLQHWPSPPEDRAAATDEP